MKISRIDYSRLPYWRHTDLSYILHNEALLPFIAYPPSPGSFGEAIRRRSAFPADRSLLLRALKNQYSRLGLSLPIADDVLLDPGTFTVTTAHQPSLLTGPLYYMYKIASVIHLAAKAQVENRPYTILPLFVIGAEDHDWEEINHFHLFGRRYEWEREASGPCGRLSLEGLETVVHTVNDLFANSSFADDIRSILENSLQKASDYAGFHHLLLHALFGRHGLIILNMDDPDLKRAFIPVMEKEIREQFSIEHVPLTQSALEKAGFKPQAFCRPVNLFYLSDRLRERIDVHDDKLIRVESGTITAKEDLVAELRSHPERFSPNVILRPLYQEFILPNLAYIGGGGELGYWMERKSQFEEAGVHFPVLIRRNSLLLIDDSTRQQIEKAELTWEELLEDYDTVAKSFLLRHAHTDLNFDTGLDMIRNAYQNLSAKAEALDPTLAKAILAEETRQLRQFGQLASRLVRAEKQLQETGLKRIQKLKDKLFPGGSLQERRENFLSWYARLGPAWIDEMIRICDPFEEKFTVVVEEDASPEAC